jgi:membrane protein implicated in regulation of membrane protease activity
VPEADSNRHEETLRTRRKIRNRLIALLAGAAIIVALGDMLDVSFWLILIVVAIFSFIASRYWVRPYQKEWNEWVKGRPEGKHGV